MKNNKINKKTVSSGFSLIELIISIAILVILTGLLAPQFMKYIEKSRQAKMMQKLDTVYTALQVAYIEIPQSAKEGVGGDITIIKGVPISGAGQEICDSLSENIGSNELKKLDIIINVEDEAEYKDDLSILIIKYFPDETKLNDFYYFVKGMEEDEKETYPGTYGKIINNTPVWWK